MRFRSFLFPAVFVVSSVALAQAPDFGGKAQVEKMKSFEFMLGEWEGTAYYQIGQRKVDLVASEKVERKAGGTALFVTGYHYMVQASGAKVPMHEAAALVYWDQKSGAFRMNSQLANGLRMEFDIKVDGKGYEWEAQSPMGGMTRYKAKLTDQEWNEIGEMSTDGKTWTKMFEMNLKRKKVN